MSRPEGESIELASHPPTPSATSATAIHEHDDLPEGGYGWVIVACCSAITFFYVGLPYSWGVIQVRLTESGLAKPSSLAFVGSVATCFVAVGALANARILRAIGTRNAAVVASLLYGGGQIMSSWSMTSFAGLLITNGIIAGIGVGIFFLCCGSLPAQYFKRRRGLANGLVIGGGGLGGGVMSVTMNYLLDRVGVAWTFRIIGLTTLAVTLPASLMLKERTRRGTAHIEWSYFRDPKFILLFLGGGIATFPVLVPAFFIPQYATSLGISTSTAAFILAGFNLSSFFGRVGFGALCDYIGPVSSLILALLTSAVSMLAIWPVSKSIGPFILFSIISGAGNGGFFSTVPSAVGHIYGGHRVPIALAMIVTAWSAGYFLGAPIAGWILEKYGGCAAGTQAFRPAMYYAGTMSLGSAGLIFGVRQILTPSILSYA
ncbi:major facilitator superfamily domain-containing protein [Flagelloscypha sp. PMI_526]|nr:major facilitator superfamily domain-containing protein [Flagelloscypha sp. PMI_526]